MTAHMTAADLGLDLSDGAEDQLFRWFLASVLFGRPIQQEVAARTYGVLISHGLTAPEEFARYDREGLRALLDEGHYARLDYIMTDELHEVMRSVAAEHGSVGGMVRAAASREELTRTLVAFKGIGPTTAKIFLRELPASVLPR
ncbi:DNA methylase [Cryobacterium sp. TMT1-21]|uniref:DNA methylase n=1 Tax=Cryobacterium shii TaxID=1259235 RepID=A0AAQ2C9I0_9MICO|nr:MULTISPECIES: DNA methylase [Cryobacterium]TFC52904.1 DNA methylase [Cryobacterium shii]TFC81084.1 DNA methylase [Cryobacterium sp. TmT2-59]TFD09047.1 DNA methylase [Cryobacterium sp. TMT1-21]TFD18848.1 DNA methylase [Cryobacterium sp. TMT4-10]TFD21947.1 DNA methylase [Cryobacterium sp. TMT2-23]